MTDTFQGYSFAIDAPATNAIAVTPNDTTDLTTFSGALYIGGAGNVSLVTLGGNTVTFSGLTAGSILPVRASRIRATNTTATNIVALW